LLAPLDLGHFNLSWQFPVGHLASTPLSQELLAIHLLVLWLCSYFLHEWYSLKTGSILPSCQGTFPSSSPHFSHYAITFLKGSYFFDPFCLITLSLKIIMKSVVFPVVLHCTDELLFLQRVALIAS
jgi:hypothetical protein